MVNDDIPVATTSILIIDFGELGYYKFIDINFAGLKQDTTRMDVSLTDKNNNENFTLPHQIGNP